MLKEIHFGTFKSPFDKNRAHRIQQKYYQNKIYRHCKNIFKKGMADNICQREHFHKKHNAIFLNKFSKEIPVYPDK
jgi:hypothetical protein